MRKNRIVAAAMSAVLSLSMCFGTASVFADDYGTATNDTIDMAKTGSIEIHKYDVTAMTKAGVETNGYLNNGKKDSTAETELSKYALEGVIFSYLKVADIYTETKTSGDGIGVRVLYGFKDTALITALGLTTDDAAKVNEGTYYYTSTAISAAMQTVLTDSNTATKNTLEDYIKANGGTDMTQTSAQGVTSADGLAVGLYLIVETYVPEDVTYTTDPFVVSIPSTTNDGAEWNYDVSVYPKNQTDYPTLDKTVADDDDYMAAQNAGHAFADTATVSEGDVVNYRITSKLPAIVSKASYLTKYTFVDTLSKGSSYNADSVTLYWYESKADALINDTSKAKATWTKDSGKFTADVNDGTDNSTMTIKMTEAGFSEINPSYSGHYVVAAYSTTVKSTADFVLGDNGNANDVTLTYARTNTQFEAELKDKAIVYSYGLDLTKTFSDDNGDAAKVSFVVKNTSRKTDGADNAYYLVASKTADGRYHVTGETTDKDTATVFNPDADGKLNVYGMEAGTYKLTEIATDEGYSLLKDDIVVEITGTVATITASEATIRGQVNDKADVIYTLNDNAKATVDSVAATMTENNANVKLSVENNKRFPIPSTGAMGTFLITLLGLGAVGAGLIMGRKKEA